ncbi:MAG: cysteine desulfurase [Phycisphaerales bacterium]|nr:cysteine desulfurase [Phycisphaerales bacterium]
MIERHSSAGSRGNAVGGVTSVNPVVGEAHPAKSAFDVRKVRADFPILSTKSHGKPFVYLDNGATTQKPRVVIEALDRYYQSQNANIHRGVYELSQTATTLYEQARLTVQKFINAAHSEEIIFTRGTTESINLVAYSWGRTFLNAGDEIVVSAMEHHSNIVPWQMACAAAGATLRVIPINDAGELVMEEYARLLEGRKVKMVAINHVSNSLGTINPVKEMTALAHHFGATVLIDGAQWVAHAPTDVRDIDCDFYAFSGHKLFGPTGKGVLYGKRELLEQMPPFMGGGDMIKSVSFEKTVYADLPNKFEAGTPHIAGAIGLAAAIEYVLSIGFAAFAPHEAELLRYATQKVSEVPGLRIIGTAKRKASVISFVMDDPPISSLDLGLALDAEGVAVRTGHHCCQPVMDRFGIPATTRISLAMYNTKEDVDAAVAALLKIRAAVAKKSDAGSGKTQTAGATDGGNGQPQQVGPVDLNAQKWPAAVAKSPQAAADDLAELFEALGDRDSRNLYILELGEKLPPMPPGLKSERTRVHGCMSTVHLFGRKRPGSNDTLEFLADSDAHIVRGLIGVLQRLFSGQRAKEIIAFDVEGFFTRIGLEQFITVQRRNGLAGMVQRIRALANEILA